MQQDGKGDGEAHQLKLAELKQECLAGVLESKRKPDRINRLWGCLKEDAKD